MILGFLSEMAAAEDVGRWCHCLGERCFIVPPLSTFVERQRQKREEIEDKLRMLESLGYYDDC